EIADVSIGRQAFADELIEGDVRLLPRAGDGTDLFQQPNRPAAFHFALRMLEEGAFAELGAGGQSHVSQTDIPPVSANHPLRVLTTLPGDIGLATLRYVEKTFDGAHDHVQAVKQVALDGKGGKGQVAGLRHLARDARLNRILTVTVRIGPNAI